MSPESLEVNCNERRNHRELATLFQASALVLVPVQPRRGRAAGFGLDGTQQIMTSAGMGVVALGAGAGLVLRRANSA